MNSTIKKLATFCRRRKGAGIYTGNVTVNGVPEVIRLVDRDVITPKHLEIIKFLAEDPEIEILCSSNEEQKEEDARNLKKK